MRKSVGGRWKLDARKKTMGGREMEGKWRLLPLKLGAWNILLLEGNYDGATTLEQLGEKCAGKSSLTGSSLPLEVPNPPVDAFK